MCSMQTNRTKYSTFSNEFREKSFYKLYSAGTLSKLHKRRRRNNAISPVRENQKSKLVTSERSTYFCVKELTKDHRPDRDDERMRVEAAGGYVIEWGGVPRVNGELAISRAIGDVSFRR